MRTITITGSEGLIGKELVKYFESKGDYVHKLDLKLKNNLTHEWEVEEFFAQNKTDYLINCFAINQHIHVKHDGQYTLQNFPLSIFEDYLLVNIIATFSVCRSFARYNHVGAIVNFSSTYGTVSPRPELYSGFHKDIGYCVSKAGVINLTKYLAVHLAPLIRVNCVVPGGVENEQPEGFIDQYRDLTPLKRMMKKTELNKMLDYLCSEDSSYVTGSEFVIDGGYTAW